MTAFDEILADPFAPKAYLVTIRPCAFLAAEMAADAAENRLHAAPGTFLGLATGDWLRLGGFAESANRGWAMVIEVEPADPENPVAGPGGGWLALAGIDLADEAAGPRRLAGEVVRYFSSHGHVTRPEDVPPDTWYEPRIDNALTFTRALVDGDRIGGRSVPGFGDVVLRNEDGALDPLRVWGWAGRSIRVELGGPDFARAAFGVVFDGLTETVAFDDATLRIQVSDLQGLIEQPLWSARYLGRCAGAAAAISSRCRWASSRDGWSISFMTGRSRPMTRIGIASTTAAWRSPMSRARREPRNGRWMRPAAA
jgi:hypothetical protein